MALRLVRARGVLSLSALPSALCVGLAIVVASCGATPEPQPEVPLVAATPDEPQDTAEDHGTIDILCQPPTPALVDGKPVGTTPILGYKVSAGSHDVTIADAQTGNRTMTVKVEPGDHRTIKLDPPPTMIKQ